MSNVLSISDVGLRLIKVYEGFRPVDMELVSGQRVAGYGHRVMNGESLHLSEKKAAKLLKRDLAPYEAMVNDHVFAPLTQSQFDALCSLAFNIGPKKFLESDVVRALNNGRVLDAANGFDVWRKGHINGESYVVDALVRRRTAEKVLFLRPSQRSVRAPRVEIQAAADESIMGVSTIVSMPILEESGLVPTLNYPAPHKADIDTPIEDMLVEDRATDISLAVNATPMRRRDDRPGGVLTLSEVFDDDDVSDPLVKDLSEFNLDIASDLDVADIEGGDANETPFELDDIVEYDDLVLKTETIEDELPVDIAVEAFANDDASFDPSDYIVGDLTDENIMDDSLELTDVTETPSPIATAAAEVSGRLDALMADAGDAIVPEEKKILPFRTKTPAPILSAEATAKLRQENPLYGSLIQTDEDVAINTDTPKTNTVIDSSAQKDSASRYIANTIAPKNKKSSQSALNWMVGGGMALLGASVGAMLSGADHRYGSGGEFLTTVGVLLGLMITLGSIYYILKNMRENS